MKRREMLGTLLAGLGGLRARLRGAEPQEEVTHLRSAWVQIDEDVDYFDLAADVTFKHVGRLDDAVDMYLGDAKPVDEHSLLNCEYLGSLVVDERLKTTHAPHVCRFISRPGRRRLIVRSNYPVRYARVTLTELRVRPANFGRSSTKMSWGPKPRRIVVELR